MALIPEKSSSASSVHLRRLWTSSVSVQIFCIDSESDTHIILISWMSQVFDMGLSRLLGSCFHSRSHTCRFLPVLVLVAHIVGALTEGDLQGTENSSMYIPMDLSNSHVM
jgi:hypothetical protein